MRLTILIVALCVTVCRAGTLMEEAYDASYNLDYDVSLALYEKALAADPQNPELHSYVAYTLLYRELLRDGALDSEMVTGNNSFVRRARMEPPPDVEKRFLAETAETLRLCQQRLATNPRDAQAMHMMAVALGQRANWGFLVRKTWMASLSDSSKAHKLDTQATQIDPNFLDARLIQGVYDYIIGSLPWSMRTLGFVAGYHGDKQRGIHTIEEVAQKGHANKVDAEVVLCALYRREGHTQRAIALVQQLSNRFPRNYLLRFELAQMYGAAGQRKRALDTLADIAQRKRDNVPGYTRVPWEKIYYETGNLQFWFDDLDDALASLQKATASAGQLNELDLNTGALALMRQGQIYDLQNRHNLAVPVYRQVVQLAPEAEAARESQHYISSPYRRTPRG
ncbi:MAG TPA: tetratricopeptide repeat protein [Bryobacteraceae bacterium]|nr:tetratricopeptide repeat protein [Bryobacteraceae bacterium]